MIFINSWATRSKQWGKTNIKIRIGKITIFDLYADFYKKQFGLIFFNFGIKKG
jgi:uncharacterized protein (DUF2164 family)